MRTVNNRIKVLLVLSFNELAVQFAENDIRMRFADKHVSFALVCRNPCFNIEANAVKIPLNLDVNVRQEGLGFCCIGRRHILEYFKPRR